MIAPVAVIPEFPTLASPKSVTLGSPHSSSITFAGLRSRWTIPLAWAAATPSAIFATISAAPRGENRPPASSFSARLPPATNSSTKYGRPSC
jgi:hypothetical protein